MAQIQATYNGITISPILDWEYDQSPIMTPTGKKVTGYNVSYRIKGFFANTSAADLKTDMDLLILKLRESGGTLTITQGGVDKITLNATMAKGSGPHSTVTFPGNTDRLKVGFNIPFTLVVTAIVDPVVTGDPNILANSYTTTYAYDKQNKVRRTTRGQIKFKAGVSAILNVASYDPGIPAGYERLSSEIEVDDEVPDELANYAFVDGIEHENKQTGASDEDWKISTKIEGQTEIWTLTGTLKYKQGKKPTLKTDAKTLKGKSGFPSGARIIDEQYDIDLRNNIGSFVIVGEVALGKNGIIEYSQSVQTISSADIQDFKATDDGGSIDVRQTLGRPEHQIIQSWSASAHGGFPSWPTLAGNKEDMTDKDETEELPKWDNAGRKLRYNRSARYTFKPLNRVTPGSLAPAQALPSDNPFDGRQSKSSIA